MCAVLQMRRRLRWQPCPLTRAFNSRRRLLLLCSHNRLVLPWRTVVMCNRPRQLQDGGAGVLVREGAGLRDGAAGGPALSASHAAAALSVACGGGAHALALLSDRSTWWRPSP
jgi:hypothetical protein